MTALLLLAGLAFAIPEVSTADANETTIDLSIAGQPIGQPVSDAEQLRLRTRELSQGLRCPVCQGLSSADSQAESAIAMRVRVEKLVAAGYSDQQVREYFIGRYGDWVVLEPPKRGRHLMVWFAPLVALGLGGLAVGSRIVKARKPAPAPAQDAAPKGSSAEDDPYKRQILDELEG